MAVAPEFVFGTSPPAGFADPNVTLCVELNCHVTAPPCAIVTVAGEKVVTAGVNALAEGQRVKPEMTGKPNVTAGVQPATERK